MYCQTDLITDGLPPLYPKLFEEFRQQALFQGRIYNGAQPQQHFINQATEYFLSSQRNRLLNLDHLSYQHAIMGCNHFIDSLIMQHGIDHLQIFEHDYRYYSRLGRTANWAKLGHLVPKKPLLIAAPFPGALDLHWSWNDILIECQDKQIPVHIDASWLGSAKDITLDLSTECIASIGISLSKGLGLAWNRVGVRYTRTPCDADSIGIFNRHNMLPESLLRIGVAAIDTIPIDYLWDQWESTYNDACRALRLRPTKIIHAAMTLDRKQLYGMSKILLKK